jgi:Zn-dependent peptidase ImmA (M78 family)
MTKAATVHVPRNTMTWARERARVEIRAAAEKVEHSEDDLRAWESGDADPPVTALRTLAKLYGLPLAAFLLSTPKAEPDPPVDQRALAGIVNATVTPELASALNRARGLQGLASELHEELDEEPFIVVAGNVEPEWLAAQERATLGIDVVDQLEWGDEGEALRRWRLAVERRGAYVLQMSLAGTDVRAFSLRADPPVIVLDRSDWVRARIFSLAHELGHVVVGGAGICVPGTSRATGIEAWCNRFADALLVPSDALGRDTDAARIARGATADSVTVRRIANRFKVSPAVVWYRLHQTRTIDDATFNAGWDEWSVWRPNLPEGGGGQTTAKNVIRDYGIVFPELLLKASRRGVLNEADIAQYLRVQPETIPSIEAEVASRLAT